MRWLLCILCNTGSRYWCWATKVKSRLFIIGQICEDTINNATDKVYLVTLYVCSGCVTHCVSFLVTQLKPGDDYLPCKSRVFCVVWRRKFKSITLFSPSANKKRMLICVKWWGRGFSSSHADLGSDYRSRSRDQFPRLCALLGKCDPLKVLSN